MDTHVNLIEVQGKGAMICFVEHCGRDLFNGLIRLPTFACDTPTRFRIVINREPVFVEFTFNRTDEQFSDARLVYLQRQPQQPQECWKWFEQFVTDTSYPGLNTVLIELP